MCSIKGSKVLLMLCYAVGFCCVVIEKMRGMLVSMKKSAPGGDEQFKTAVNTLLKYIGNIARAPEEEKFRSIKSSNAAFQQRVAAVPGSLDFLHLCGFEVRWREGCCRGNGVNGWGGAEGRGDKGGGERGEEGRQPAWCRGERVFPNV